ncbi:MAG TPA: MGMT family protein [Pelovirga sp.]|nr:MGMT family protein [Pelovirga sp.]
MSNVSLYQHIYHLVKLIPRGQVSSYGRLARLAGTTPRVVGFALAALPEQSAVPWQRVINSQGRVSARKDSDRAKLQRVLLEAEGVGFDACGRVSSAPSEASG